MNFLLFPPLLVGIAASNSWMPVLDCLDVSRESFSRTPKSPYRTYWVVPGMVVGGGIEPPVFTAWVEVLQTSVVATGHTPRNGCGRGSRTLLAQVMGLLGSRYRIPL